MVGGGGGEGVFWFLFFLVGCCVFLGVLFVWRHVLVWMCLLFCCGGVVWILCFFSLVLGVGVVFFLFLFGFVFGYFLVWFVVWSFWGSFLFSSVLFLVV